MADIAPAVGAQLYPDAFPQLQILCDVVCEANPVEIIETRYPAAVTLAAIAGNPELSNIIMDAHMEDFSTIIGDEEELSERIAFENSISTQNENENQIDSNYGPIIIGESEIPVAVNNANYTNLITFITHFGIGQASIATLNVLMFYLHVLIYGTFGIQQQQTVLIYNNILLVRHPNVHVDRSSLMPKYSFNILCEKEPLLQTRLTAGRENGMGALLERFICKILQPFFDSIIVQGFAKVKLIAPTESNNIWQIKLSVFGNDFILVSLQIINVKAAYLADPLSLPFGSVIINQIYTNLITPIPVGSGWTINTDVVFDNPFYNTIIPIITVDFLVLQAQLYPPPVPPPPVPNPNPQNLLRYCLHNLCFSLYNKCLSKDFNCLCSLSEADTNMFKIIDGIVIAGNGGFNAFYDFIQLFLNNLVDTLIIKKKQYFLFGLLNLISCSYQDRYTLETKAYEVIFDKAAPNFNLFLESMRLIELVNRECAAIPINIVMGGGKQYSLFQIALNNYFTTPTGLQVFNALFTQQQFPGITGELQHNNVKPAADADFGMFHPGNNIEDSIETALGSTMCMSVCMLLQISLKKKIDSLFVRAPLNINYDYDIDIGNSCIGNPPTTLSSLRINLHNSYIFYTDVKAYLDRLVADAAAAAAAAAVAPQAMDPVVAAITTAIQFLDTLTVHPFFAGIITVLTRIASVISPYDFVLKGTMENYIIHILDSVYNFNTTAFAIWNNTADAGAAGAAAVAAGATAADFLANIIKDYAQRLNPFMFTSQGFSSPLKGIFDIFYTLFIIENFANRSLVTQKINKELKRIAICAQVLYIHFNELLMANPAFVANPDFTGIIVTLRNMIINGYNASNLLGANFQIIMNIYVDFVYQLSNVAALNIELLFYCAPHNPAGRTLTNIENYFMNFLVYSSPNPPPGPPPAPPGTLAANVVAAGNTAAANVVPPFPPQIIAVAPADIILRSLSCIPNVIAILPTIQQHVHSLYKNKLYAACRDTVNKSEGVIAIASAYQSFLWSILNLEKIKRGDDTHCYNILAGSSGIGQVLYMTTNAGLNTLVGSLNPCWSNFAIQADDLLDLNKVLVPPYNDPLLVAVPPRMYQNLDDVIFQYIDNNNLGRFLIFSWFITSIFGIKTKSKPSKILALGRTYLKLFVESYRNDVVAREGRLENELFGCVFSIRNNPQIQRAVNEGGVELFFACTNPSILCLTYSSFNIKDALEKYRELQNGYNIPGEGGNDVVQKIQIYDAAQGRNPFQVLGINCRSKVFEEVILQQLLIRFSVIPKGKQFTITASTNMGILLRELNQKIVTFIQTINAPIVVFDRPRFADLCKKLVTELFPRVKELNIYTPGKHDVSKFENFIMVTVDCNSRYFRTKWIIYLVRGILNIFNTVEATAPSFVYKNMKLFILLLKYLINIGEESNLHTYIPTVLTAFDVVGYAIHTNAETLAQVQILINSEYPDIDAACVVRNRALIGERKVKPEDKKGYQPKASTKIDPKKLIKELANMNEVLEGIDVLKRPKVATEAASKLAKKQDATTSTGIRGRIKRQGGGTIRIRNPRSPKKPNNHTRKNKYKRNNKNKKHKSSPKYRKINPSSRSGSQSNRNKSKSKLPQKNVTFKRRMYNK